MTDKEIICEWMEPKPDKGPYDFRPLRSRSPMGWWRAYHLDGYNAENQWLPRTLNLDRLHLVEERLSDEQIDAYLWEIVNWMPDGHRCMTGELGLTKYGLLHASAAQKIAALATVLREGGKDAE